MTTETPPDDFPGCSCGCGFTALSAAKLTRSGIPHADAGALGITPLVTLDDLPEDFSSVRPLIQSRGLLLTGTENGGAVSYCARPDAPVDDRTGRPVKYVHPKGDGAGSPLWRLWGAYDDHPELIVEGELQSRAVARWAPPGTGVTGINGCRGWSQRDLSFARGRRVLVLLDKDVETNPHVLDAAVGLENELYDAKASEVLFISLPDDPGAAPTDGPDDYLGRLPQEQRREFVASLIAGAEPLRDPAVDEFESGLLTTADLDSIPAPAPLIPGWLHRDSLVRLVGEPGTGKSFTALEWAAAVGTGGTYADSRAVQGDVLYVVAEGTSGIRQRVRAWEKHNGTQMTGVHFRVSPVQVMGAGDGTRDRDWKSLVSLCRRRKFSMIVFDTQSRVTVGVEENSNTEMGRVVDRLESLREVTGACILLVHHTAKGGDNGRGAGVVTGALTSEFLLTRDVSDEGKVLKLENTKEKDAEDGSVRYLRMQVVDVSQPSGSDPFAVPVTSVVLVEADPNEGLEQVARAIEEKLPDKERAFRERSHELFSDGRGNSKAEIRKMALVGDERAGLLPIMSESTFHRTWARLQKEDLIVQIGTTQKFKVAPPGVGAAEFRVMLGELEDDAGDIG